MRLYMYVSLYMYIQCIYVQRDGQHNCLVNRRIGASANQSRICTQQFTTILLNWPDGSAGGRAEISLANARQYNLNRNK